MTDISRRSTMNQIAEAEIEAAAQHGDFMDYVKTEMAKLTVEEIDQSLSRDPAPGEAVLGIVPEEIRPIFALSCKISEDLSEVGEIISQDAEEQLPLADFLKVSIRALDKKEEHDLILGIFWASLRRRMPGAGAGVGVRKGWKVVQLHKQNQSPVALLEELASLLR